MKLPLLPQQGEHRLRHHIGLGQHGCRGLREDLRAGECRDFCGNIRVADRRFTVLDVLDLVFREGDRERQAVLIGTQGTALVGYFEDCLVEHSD